MTALSGQIVDRRGRPVASAPAVVVLVDPRGLDALGLTPAQRADSDLNETIEAYGVDSAVFDGLRPTGRFR